MSCRGSVSHRQAAAGQVAECSPRSLRGALRRGSVGVVIGPDGRVVEWLPKVDPATYPQEVLSRLPAPKDADQPTHPE
jgi:hypothetical protein